MRKVFFSNLDSKILQNHLPIPSGLDNDGHFLENLIFINFHPLNVSSEVFD